MIFFIILWSIIIISLILALGILKVREREKENKNMELYMLSLEMCYEVVKKRMEAVRMFRHDLAKHIQTLEYMLEEPIEIKDDLKKILESSAYCQNQAVNAVLQMKVEECQKKEIPLKMEIADELYDSMEEIDLVGVLYNLIDNAIEANERITNVSLRGMKVNMWADENGIRILIGNQVVPGEKIDFRTRKDDIEAHGYGTRIIERIIQKYHGKKEIIFDSKANYLSVCVCFDVGRA